NLVPPYETRETGLHGVSAALEFAVCVLGVKHIVVMGHSHCAGIQTLMTPEKLGNSDFIGQWVNVAEPAREKTLANHPHADAEALCHHCEQESVLLSLQNLLTFPWVKSRADAGDLKLHGWYFSLETGKLEGYDPAKSQFVTL
ncbi:MAG: carbonic anhydrase, partial [Rickettsiales bacterium]